MNRVDWRKNILLTSHGDYGEHNTVLVTLLISDTNSTAYPTLIYGLYLPYGPGVGLRGLGWRFLTLTERALKE